MSPRPPLRRLGGLSDERLLALVREGHEQAFDALVSRYQCQLVTYCRRLGLSESRAEDAVQQSFLNAWLAIRRGDEVRNLRAWLTRIAHNRSLNMMQASAEVRSSELDIALLGDSYLARSDPDEGLAVRDALADVAALPQMQREALILSAVDGRSYEEVAQKLGISEGAVRGLVHRARTALRDAAAVLSPIPLLRSAAGWLRGSSTSAARALEIASPSGAAPMGGALGRGLASAATALVLAAGVAVSPLHRLFGSWSSHGAPKVVAQRPSAPSRTSSLLTASTKAGGPGAVSVASVVRVSTGSAPGPGTGVRRAGKAPQSLTPPGTGSPAGEVHGLPPKSTGSPLAPQPSSTSAPQASSASSGSVGTASPPPAEAEAPRTEATPPVESKAPEHSEGSESDDGSEHDGPTSGESEHPGGSDDESERQRELTEGGEVTPRSGHSDN